MYNRINFKEFFVFFLTLYIISCKSVALEKQPICYESIRVSIFDSSINEVVKNFRLYEVTSYPEGIIMKLQTVAEQYKFNDSLGIVCLPLIKEDNVETVRKFIFVKNGYVYTEYYLRNRSGDTLLNAIKINSND